MKITIRERYLASKNKKIYSAIGHYLTMPVLITAGVAVMEEVNHFEHSSSVYIFCGALLGALLFDIVAKINAKVKKFRSKKNEQET